MQRGSLALVSRKEGPDVWQFRWSEKDLHGRVQRKRVIGTVERYPDGAAARTAMTIVLAELNSGKARISCGSITVAQLCDHFEQRELTRDNTWRSYSTKKTCQAYLNRWILPHWRRYELAEVRTIQVESWLRRLPLAKSSCAKSRNLMSVLFNHACRYELFDRNPRKTAKGVELDEEPAEGCNQGTKTCPFTPGRGFVEIVASSLVSDLCRDSLERQVTIIGP